ncbi:YceD family protein [Brevundimonas sp.]|uniref:YceD family protein n=1 Tax=Brevundimonas sp. TaxID=1871086 RepID=UPI003D145628
MNPGHRLPFSQVVRINEIGAGLERHLVPDEDARKRVIKALDLASLSVFEADLKVSPGRMGWTLSGRVVATLEQVCGITLDPLPVEVDERFSVDLVEAAEPEPDEIEVTLDDDAPDVIEDGRIDLGQYAVEQLALALDPFPRKPGAEFVQPEEPAEISPFAVLKAFKPKDDDGKS